MRYNFKNVFVPYITIKAFIFALYFMHEIIRNDRGHFMALYSRILQAYQ